MLRDKTVRFQSRYVHDLALHREFRRGCAYTNRTLVIALLIAIPVLCFLFILMFQVPSLARPLAAGIFVCGTFCSLLSLIHRIRNRNGDPLYRKMLSEGDGKPITFVTTLTDSGIERLNLNSGNAIRYNYAQIQSVFETENLIVAVVSPQDHIIMDKTKLLGGASGFVAFLVDHCPNLKPKKLQDITPGWLCSKVLGLLILCGFLLSVIRLSDTGRITAAHPVASNASYTELAGVLEGLGITGCSDALIAELEEIEASYPDYYSSVRDPSDRFLNLLCWMGMGEYDYDTWEWTPCEGGVYWFDIEVFQPDTMYSDFLRGIAGTSGGVLVFTDIQEDTSQVNWEQGTGTQSVTFCWNGQTYTLEGEVMNDWFDLTVILDLQEILKANDDGKQLYFAFDGGQGLLVFYRDSRWAADFEAITGIDLTTNPALTGLY